VSQAANLMTFGSLWIVQYFLLDRVLFGRRARGQAGPEITAARGGQAVASTPPRAGLEEAA
jgi:hypothetical protein